MLDLSSYCNGFFQRVIAKEKSSISVSKDTYQSIARFAILHSLNQETTALLKVAEVKFSNALDGQMSRRSKQNALFLQKELQAVADAEDELLLVDDESEIPCQVDHPSFFNKSKDQAGAFLEEEKTRLQKEIDELTQKRAQNESDISELRTLLYSKLGDAVQLEGNEEEDDD